MKTARSSTEIVDASMQTILAVETLDVTYDKSVWPLIESVEPGVSVYLQGEGVYRIGNGAAQTLPDSPLLVGFTVGEGKVFFSTYRSEVNDTPNLRIVLSALLEAM